MIGSRGLTVLLLAGLVGIALAVIGWSQRYTGLVAHAVGGLGSSVSASAAPSASASISPRSATTAPKAEPSAAPSASASAGPLLSSEPFASYAYLEWPGTPTTTARQAASGLTISVSRQRGGIAVQAGVTGQALPSPRFYASGQEVYVIESSLGDDATNVDYNLGDDGLVVTDAHGRILQ
jgi:hypothetical protein